jgi:hypothetical protein
VHLFNKHGQYIKSNHTALMTLLRTLQKHVTQQYGALQKLAEENKYTMMYLRSVLDNCPPEALNSVV